jgi:hypothetical protein
MKIIFNRCNAIFFFISHMFLNTYFFICAYFLNLNCKLLDKDGGRWDENEEGRRSTRRTVEETQEDDDVQWQVE